MFSHGDGLAKQPEKAGIARCIFCCAEPIFRCIFCVPTLNINTNPSTYINLFHTNSNVLSAECYTILKDSCDAMR